jgi:hypothetical protein
MSLLIAPGPAPYSRAALSVHASQPWRVDWGPGSEASAAGPVLRYSRNAHHDVTPRPEMQGKHIAPCSFTETGLAS